MPFENLSQIKKKIQRDNGEVMIESLIVYLVTFTLLFMVLALMMVSYQKFTIKTVASDVAVKVAQNIRYSEVPIESGIYKSEDIQTLFAYRYLFGNDENLLSELSNAGKEYTYDRLMKTTFRNVVTKDNTDVSIRLVHDGPGLRHVTVSIKGKYKLPFDEILDFFNLSNITEYEAEESAECIDILDYVNYVDFSKNIVDIIYGDTGKIGKLIDKVWALVNKFINY